MPVLLRGQERIAWLIHHAATTGIQNIPWWARYSFWMVTPVFEFQVALCWIATGALAMLVTLTRRTRTVLVAAAVLCVLAVVLPSPMFNFARHNQELTVAFVIPANPDASAAKPLKGFSVATGSHWLSKTGADAVAAHVLEALRKAGLPGPYRVAEVNQSGTGKKALQIIVLNPPFPAEAQLPQPDGTELIYVSKPDGWHTIPRKLNARSQCGGSRAKNGLPLDSILLDSHRDLSSSIWRSSLACLFSRSVPFLRFSKPPIPGVSVTRN